MTHPLPQTGGSYIREKDGSLRPAVPAEEKPAATPPAKPTSKEA